MKLNWLWEACFYDENSGKEAVYIVQPPDDRYSKHNDSAEWNPSSYRDFLDYFKCHKDELRYFKLEKDSGNEYVVVDFSNDSPYICKCRKVGEDFKYYYEPTTEGVTDAQPIYYREMQNTSVNGVFGEPECIAYVVGFQGKKDGKNYQQVVRVLSNQYAIIKL